MLALRQFDFRASFPPQKLKTAHGEFVCMVLEFLTDKALEGNGFSFATPIYASNEEVIRILLYCCWCITDKISIFHIVQIEQAEADDDNEDDDIIEDDTAGGIDEDIQFEEASRMDTSMDASHHNILQALVDPVEWKTELERVGPKLRANQQLVTNEWRAHVDQTVASKGHIEKVLNDTQGDLHAMNK